MYPTERVRVLDVCSYHVGMKWNDMSAPTACMVMTGTLSKPYTGHTAIVRAINAINPEIDAIGMIFGQYTSQDTEIRAIYGR